MRTDTARVADPAAGADLGDRCHAWRKGVDPCQEPPTSRFLKGCVHEHVAIVGHCAEHAEKALTGRLRCRPCRQAGCPCLVQVIPA